MTWFISNIEIPGPSNNAVYIGNKLIYTSPKLLKAYGDEIKILVEGYVLPRRRVFIEYSSYEDLVFQLFKKYKFNFIHSIKGQFTIVLINGEDIYVYNDYQGINKYFTWQDQNKYCISSDLRKISVNFDLELAPDNLILFNLLEHFFDGRTLFKKLYYSTPANCTRVVEKIITTKYWKETDLLEYSESNEDFTDLWKEIISGYFDHLSIKSPTLTLTGGNDSRQILAAVLNINKPISTFSFGNPASFDSIVSKELAEAAGLANRNHFVSNPTKEWFDEYATKIISKGNSLINIHRAHRLDAIEKELESSPEIDAIFAGFMGGDYIKGIIYDDYITAKIMRFWNELQSNRTDILQTLLADRFLRINQLNISEIRGKLLDSSLNNSDRRIREFNYVFNIIGGMHDAQDINVFNSEVGLSINPFMDIDFLALLFSSPFHMLRRNNSTKNQLLRLAQPGFQVKMTDALIPHLSNIRYAKRGYYSPNEYLGNKLIYTYKRFRRINQNRDYAQSFAYGNWFKEYCTEKIEDISPDIAVYFDIASIRNWLLNNEHSTTEGYWHKISNLINLDLNYKYFTNE